MHYWAPLGRQHPLQRILALSCDESKQGNQFQDQRESRARPPRMPLFTRPWKPFSMTVAATITPLDRRRKGSCLGKQLFQNKRFEKDRRHKKGRVLFF